jgi:hypothetical protein
MRQTERISSNIRPIIPSPDRSTSARFAAIVRAESIMVYIGELPDLFLLLFFCSPSNAIQRTFQIAPDCRQNMHLKHDAFLCADIEVIRTGVLCAPPASREIQEKPLQKQRQ